MVNNDSRHSVAQDAQLISDPVERAEIEVLNGLKQYDLGVRIIQDALERGSFQLRLSLILSLHREALQRLNRFAGNFRPADVEIKGSNHEPIGAHLVAESVEEMCDYVNDNWKKATAIHLSAYLMWRLNWIHPFADGNGRTSRIISYVILCIKTENVLPGTPTIPEQIVKNRTPYFDALDSADEAFKNGEIDVSEMEKLLSGMLAVQLENVYQTAGGNV